MQELIFPGVIARLRDLQRNTRFVNGIESTIHIGKWPGRYAPENAVLADFLTRSKHVFAYLP
jgi:hypothetical protein